MRKILEIVEKYDDKKVTMRFVERNLRRNNYFGIRVTVEGAKDSWDAWSMGANVISKYFGKLPVEDNTIGQVAQSGSRPRIEKESHFHMHVNLWGMKIKPIKERILKKATSVKPLFFWIRRWI